MVPPRLPIRRGLGRLGKLGVSKAHSHMRRRASCDAVSLTQNTRSEEMTYRITLGGVSSRVKLLRRTPARTISAPQIQRGIGIRERDHQVARTWPVMGSSVVWAMCAEVTVAIWLNGIWGV